MFRLARVCWQSRWVRPRSLATPRRWMSTPINTSRVASRPIAELLHNDQDSDKVMDDVAKWVNARFQAPIDTPSGWSNEWDKYDQLLTLFWPSPYPLHLRQMEMIINVQYRIKGDIVPLLYSSEPTSPLGKDAFLFEIRDERDVYVFDIESRNMYRMQVDNRDEALIVLQSAYDATVSGKEPSVPLTVLSPDREGSKALERLLQGDTTVKETLKEYLTHSDFTE